MTISKSDYLLFLKHPAWLWLKKNDKDKLPPIDENLQKIFDTGHLFETYAEQLFPDGVKLGFENYDEYITLPQRTKEALDSGTKTIFQGRFEADNTTCIIDILDRVEDNTYDLIEVKSSTKAKPEHLPDLAFQTIVLEKSGLTIRNISVIHVNNQYVREGTVEPDQLSSRTDITQEVSDIIPDTQEGINQTLQVAVQPNIPDISPRFANSGTLKDWLDIYKTLKSDLGNYSIYHLASPSIKRLTELEDRGIINIADIPDDFNLSPKQQFQTQTTKTRERIINIDEIKAFLETFQFPLYFLDYETLGDLIPPFDGMKPYQQLPFQYSLHILKEPNGEVEHVEYLHTENSNPGQPFTKHLQNHIGNESTILVWHESFEKGCNLTLADMLPDDKEFLLSVNNRIKDLMTPFSQSWFVDKDFFGSASLKAVLPVLIPDLSYQNLDISDGQLAQRLWMETVLDGKNQDIKDQIMKNLLEYCQLDTLAMVKIWQVLVDASS